MATQNISITRALVELKRIGERINAATSQGKFVAVQVGQETKAKVQGSNASIADTVTQIQGSFDKVDALIKNRSALKAAIVKSNANTNVVILGQTMTVAEAIELKSTVAFREQYLNMLRYQLTNARNVIDRGNNELEASIDKLLTTMYGSEKTKVDADAYNVVANPQKANKLLSLIDPAGIEKRIEKLQEEINNINGEIDFVLSESNARTTVAVDM